MPPQGGGEEDEGVAARIGAGRCGAPKTMWVWAVPHGPLRKAHGPAARGGGQTGGPSPAGSVSEEALRQFHHLSCSTFPAAATRRFSARVPLPVEPAACPPPWPPRLAGAQDGVAVGVALPEGARHGVRRRGRPECPPRWRSPPAPPPAPAPDPRPEQRVQHQVGQDVHGLRAGARPAPGPGSWCAPDWCRRPASLPVASSARAISRGSSARSP
jgi:hypothetical protein